MDARTHGGDHVKRKILPIAAMASMLVSVARAEEGAVRAEIVARLPESVGNIAVTPDNQLIFSHHPFFNPEIRVARLTSPTTFQPFPNADWNTPRKGTDQYLDNVLGLRSDEKGIVWMIDMGFRTKITPKLVGWNTRTDKLERIYYMPEPITRGGSSSTRRTGSSISPTRTSARVATAPMPRSLPSTWIRVAPGVFLTEIGRRSLKTCRSPWMATISRFPGRMASQRSSRSDATASPWTSDPNGSTSHRLAAVRSIASALLI